MKVYVVAEYPHGTTDDIHRIVLVTTDEAVAKRKAQPDYTFFIEEHEVEVPR